MKNESKNFWVTSIKRSILEGPWRGLLFVFLLTLIILLPSMIVQVQEVDIYSGRLRRCKAFGPLRWASSTIETDFSRFVDASGLSSDDIAWKYPSESNSNYFSYSSPDIPSELKTLMICFKLGNYPEHQKKEIVSEILSLLKEGDKNAVTTQVRKIEASLVFDEDLVNGETIE